ncbi:MAG: HAMP domain-containing protein, partial [Oscillospiraceae bacterium]
MEQASKRKLKNSVQLKFAGYFAVLIAVLLVVLNTYPLQSSRDIVFSEKESALVNRAAVVSSSLSLLESLTPDNTRQVMGLLDVNDLTRIMVTDDAGLVLYDTAEEDNAVGRYALFSEISRALGGETVFYSRFHMEAFVSRAAMPVRSSSRTIGAVYLCEYDREQADLIVGIQHRLGTITVVVGVVAMVLILFSIRIMTRRITRLADGVRIVQSGDYSFRLESKGHDELTELGDEFNNLTERLETTEAQRRRFVSDASHELKTPLASIRLLADSIVQSKGMDPA